MLEVDYGANGQIKEHGVKMEQVTLAPDHPNAPCIAYELARLYQANGQTGQAAALEHIAKIREMQHHSD